MSEIQETISRMSRRVGGLTDTFDRVAAACDTVASSATVLQEQLAALAMQRAHELRERERRRW